nr:class GN sortase [Pseudohoeflea suaedae]
MRVSGRKPASPARVRRPFLILVALIALAGCALVFKGLYIHAKAALAQTLLETSFARAIGKPEATRPWPWADFTTEARLTARRLGTSDIVLSDAGGEALAFGPALIGGTARPGDEGTSVIAAHRDTHFNWLREVRPGDFIDVTRRDGAKATFIVRSARIARSDASGIDPHRDGHWMALATCWPFDAAQRGPLRYIVDAERVDDETTLPPLASPPNGLIASR